MKHTIIIISVLLNIAFLMSAFNKKKSTSDQLQEEIELGTPDSSKLTINYQKLQNGKKIIKSILLTKKDSSYEFYRKKRVVQEIFFDTNAYVSMMTCNNGLRYDNASSSLAYNTNEIRFDKTTHDFKFLRLMRDYKIMLELQVFSDSLINFTTDKDGISLLNINEPRALIVK